MASVEIGYNRRCYVTFEIKDVTPEEFAQIEQAVQNDYDEETFTLLRKMEAEGRLTQISEEHEDGPEVFAQHVEPNVIDITEGDY
jgi:hypothetical protein